MSTSKKDMRSGGFPSRGSSGNRVQGQAACSVTHLHWTCPFRIWMGWLAHSKIHKLHGIPWTLFELWNQGLAKNSKVRNGFARRLAANLTSPGVPWALLLLARARAGASQLELAQPGVTKTMSHPYSDIPSMRGLEISYLQRRLNKINGTKRR